MESVRRQLAELTGRDVEHVQDGNGHAFRLVDAAQQAHWLHIDDVLVAEEGEAGVLQRLVDVLPHLTTEGQSLRVTLTRHRVIAEPAAD